MKSVNILIISLLLLFLKITFSTAFSSQSLIGSIVELFQTPAHCCMIVYFSNVSSEFELNDVTIPLYLMNTNAETEKMHTASQICKNHIFIMNTFDDLEEIKDHEISLARGATGKYAIIVQKSSQEFFMSENFNVRNFHKCCDVKFCLFTI